MPSQTVSLIGELTCSKSDPDYRLNLLIGYSGTEVLVDKSNEVGELNINNAIGESAEFKSFLSTNQHTLSKVEVIIRSGEFARLSDAPLLETLNSVFILIPKLFPEVTVGDVESVISNYLDFKTKGD